MELYKQKYTVRSFKGSCSGRRKMSDGSVDLYKAMKSKRNGNDQMIISYFYIKLKILDFLKQKYCSEPVGL